MLRNPMKRWLEKMLRSGAPTPSSRRKQCRLAGRPRFVPRLEALEMRWLPSSIVVNTTVDNVNDANISGPTVTLREAINYDNANGGGTISFAPSAFSTPQTITLSQGALHITSNMTITGLAAGPALSGNHATQIFNVAAGVTANLSSLTIENGSAGSGGGIANAGALTLSNATLAGNSATSQGGGIYNAGTLTLSNSTLSGNSGGYAGGGICNRGTLALSNAAFSGNSASSGGGIYNAGTATVSNATFSGNSTHQSGGGLMNVGTMTLSSSTLTGNHALNGGGIYNAGVSALTLSNSTLQGNSATGYGGGMFGAGGTLSNVTISGNSAGASGGGIGNYGTLALQNTIVAANTAPKNANVLGSYFGSGTVSGSHNLTSGTPDLNGLSPNGGPTQTLSEQAFSFNPGYLQNGTYLPVNPGYTTLLTGISVASITGIVSGVMGGNYINGNAPAQVYNYTNNGTTATFVLAFFDGTYTKAAQVQLTNPFGNSVVATQLSARYWTGNVLGAGFNYSSTSGATGQTPGSGGYGVRSFVMTGSPTLGQGGAVTTVGSSGITSTATTIAVSAAAAIASTPGAYLIRIDSEDLLVTNVNLSSNTLTVVRGYDGTTAATHAAGAGVYFLTDQRGYAYSTNTPDIGAYQSTGVAPGTPSVSGVSPSGGPGAGGSVVTITGTNLANATAVHFGALAGTILSDSATQIVAVTPAESLGSVDTTVITPGGTSATSAADQFTFATPPATTLVVTDTGDSASDTGSLRYALSQAQNGYTISFAGNLVGDTITLGSQLTISHNLTITGLASALAISGNHATQVFNVAAGVTANLSNLTIENGSAANGGGISNAGTLTLSNSTLAGNSAGVGGGIFNNGTLMLSNATLSGNSATGGGGGIWNQGTLTLSNSTLAGNSCNTSGGGIFNVGTLTLTDSTLAGNSSGSSGGAFGNVRTMTVSNSTLVGNSAGYVGGGITNDGTLAVSNSTLSGNSAIHSGGGILNAGTLALQNTIVAGNTAANNANLAASFFGSGTVSGSHNLTSGNAALNALASNGGPTQTLAEQAGSPALAQGGAVTTVGTDNGSTIVVANAAAIASTPGAYLIRIDSEDLLVTNVNLGSNTLTVVRGYNGTTAATHAAGAGVYFLTDQRGYAYSTNTPDIGAYQSTGAAPGTPTVTGVSPNNGFAGSVVIITGTNLANATAVDFGLLPGTIVSDSATQIAAIPPAEPPGTVDTTVTTLGLYTSATSAADQFTFVPPAVTSVSPSGGPGAGGSVVTITGTNLANATAVHFGALAGTILSDSATQIVAVTPAESLGSVDTTVITPGGTSATSAADQFTFVTPPANTFVVTDTSDSASDTGSLRYALSQAQNGYSIAFASSLIGATITLGSVLTISHNVTITGLGSALALSGNHATRVFNAAAGVTANLSYLTIENGSARTGAGIYNAGTLTLSNSTLSGNSGSYGGGIYNTGTLTLSNSTLSGNSAAAVGGGIDNNGGTLTVSNSTISGSIGGYGGGIYSTGTLTLSNSTLSGNSAAASGGGIDNNGRTLTLSNSTLSGNSAKSGGGIYNQGGMLALSNATLSRNSASNVGGGIYNNGGTLTLSSSTLSGNSATIDGGGIANPNGTVTLSNSTLSGNSATGNAGSEGGGGILNGGTLTVSNSTLSGNSAAAVGGGINNGGTLTLSNSTLSGNSATKSGGGIYNSGSPYGTGKLALQNTIVAANTASSAPDIYGTINTDNGHNLLGTALSGTTSGTGDKFSNAPGLASLASNGGPTQTLAEQAGSPALAQGGAVTTVGTDNGSTIVVANAAAIASTPGAYLIRIDSEDLLVTNVNLGSNTLSVVRGYNGTAAATHAAGAGVYFLTDQRGHAYATNTPDIGAYQSTGVAPAPAPSVSGVSPSGGPGAGGSVVTITGTNLANATAVHFGALAGTILSDSATQVVATTPTESPGTVDTTVTTLGLYTSATSAADQFTFVPPVVTSVSPSGGPGAGGSVVTITGTNLANATAVHFGALAGTILSDSATQIVAVTPAESLGSVDTTVITPGGTSVTSAADQFTFVTPPANTFVVTDTSDSASDTGSLRYALSQAQNGASISFASSLIGDTITLGSVLTISHNVTITGLGSALALSGNHATRVFNIAAGVTANLSYLTIENGSAGSGGGIYNNGMLTLSNSTLSGNSATLYGGGMVIYGGTLTLSNSTLSGNSAAVGGGIDVEAFNSSNITATVSNSTFSGNSASNFCGGINIGNYCTLTVSNSTFSGNSCGTGDGGGISNVGTLTVSNSTFSGNSAPGGGGIYNQNALTISNLTLSGNHAVSGGGILNYGGLTLSNSTLSGNSGYSGGGIKNSGTLTLSNSTFSSNHANFGGGITNNGTLMLSNATLSGNSASDGGGIYNNTGTLTLSNATLSGNSAVSAGGGIDNYGTLTVSNSTLSGNSATYLGGIGGGGICNLGTVTVSNSTLSGNHAGAGGGICNGGGYNVGTLTLSNSTLSGNSANTGGGIYNTSTLALQNTIVAGNTASANANIRGSYSGSHNLTSGTPDLNALASNGGPTQTLAEQAGSPALAQGGAVTTVGTDNGSTIVVANAAAIASTPGAYLIRIDSEDLLVTNVNLGSNTLSVVRGYNGTTATTHSAAAGVYFLTDQRGYAYSTNTPDIGAYQSTGVAPAGVANPLEGPAAGSDSDIVAIAGPWTATSNSPWLHTTSSGTGNGVVTFSFDANTGATRTGTLTIGTVILPVTQAGSNYVGVSPLITPLSSGLKMPADVAVDGADNAYFADTGDNAIKEWNAQTGQLITLVPYGLSQPMGVAVDSAGNVYIADTGDNAIKEWHARTRQVTTLVASGLSRPTGVAVDGSGNVYIADAGDNALKEWNATTGKVTTLVGSGLVDPQGVAVDFVGNVYIADTGDKAVKEWNATTGKVTTLVSSGLASPTGVAVDGGGNVFIADAGNQVIDEWSYLTQQVTPVVSGLAFPTGVAVDVADNVYVADAAANTFKVLASALVPANPIQEGAAAGTDALAPVLPATQVLTGRFAPTSDQSWLTIGPAANGVISFSFSANTTGTARTAHITVLGQSITVTQAAGVAPKRISIRR